MLFIIWHSVMLVSVSASKVCLLHPFLKFPKNFGFAGFTPKQKYTVGPFPWKWSLLQNPDQERTNQSTGICIRLRLPYNNKLLLLLYMNTKI